MLKCGFCSIITGAMHGQLMIIKSQKNPSITSAERSVKVAIKKQSGDYQNSYAVTHTLPTMCVCRLLLKRPAPVRLCTVSTCMLRCHQNCQWLGLLHTAHEQKVPRKFSDKRTYSSGARAACPCTKYVRHLTTGKTDSHSG